MWERNGPCKKNGSMKFILFNLNEIEVAFIEDLVFPPRSVGEIRMDGVRVSRYAIVRKNVLVLHDS